jgi:hypothetical protein
MVKKADTSTICGQRKSFRAATEAVGKLPNRCCVGGIRKTTPSKDALVPVENYKTAVEGAGGINEWAGHRPEWEKAISAAKRTLKRTNRGRARNAATNGIGKKPSGKIGKKGRKTKSSKDSGSAST